MSGPKIGVMDTGIGGLYALSKLRDRNPAAELHYIGDCRNLPHNIHPPEWIAEKAQAMVDHLRERGVAALVIACHTISTLKDRLETGDLPVYDIISPALEHLREQHEGQHCLFMGTRTTIDSGCYQPDWLAEGQASYIKAIELATRIERDGAAHPETQAYIDGLLTEHFQSLGGVPKRLQLYMVCTHYFLVKDQLRASIEKLAPQTQLQIVAPSALLAAAHPKGAGEGQGGVQIALNQDPHPDFSQRLQPILGLLGMEDPSVDYVKI